MKSEKPEASQIKVTGYTRNNLPGTGKHIANITPKTILFSVRKKPVSLECPQNVERL